MPDHVGGNSTQEEIEAVALLMYHCGVSVDMNFSPSGSGANSWDVPYAIRHYFSYSNQCSLKGRDEYSLIAWQNMLKEQFELGWPVYYSGFSDSGGHAFVCDGYNDNDLFHYTGAGVVAATAGLSSMKSTMRAGLKPLSIMCLPMFILTCLKSLPT